MFSKFCFYKCAPWSACLVVTCALISVGFVIMKGVAQHTASRKLMGLLMDEDSPFEKWNTKWDLPVTALMCCRSSLSPWPTHTATLTSMCMYQQHTYTQEERGRERLVWKEWAILKFSFQEKQGNSTRTLISKRHFKELKESVFQTRSFVWI